jgi:glucose/arabinose dehydrogenase
MVLRAGAGRMLFRRAHGAAGTAVLALELAVSPLAGAAMAQIDPAPHAVAGKPIETRRPELAGDHPAFPGQTRAPYRAAGPYHVRVLASSLRFPWSLAFLPDGKMLVTEKPGAMRLVDSSGRLSQPLSGVPPVDYGGQVGLLDVTLDPAFASNKRVFFTFMESAGRGGSHMAVARATLDEGANALRAVKVIFRARPDVPKAQSANSAGRIAIAADGSLFVAIGDRSTSPPWDRAQRLDVDLGKIIHITPDGAPAAGNPFAGKPGALPEIWSLGHRTPEGLAFSPSGQLWETEHGPRGGDELNKIEPGKNYGWPRIVHGIDYPGGKINGGRTEAPGLEQPRYYWDPVIAPSGFAFYRGDLFPQWRGSVFVGGLRAGFLDRLTLKGDKVVDEEPLLADRRERIRDVRIGPDGAVYVLTDEARTGKLIKLTLR